jgi:wyosine [tRNA(Phe)-imidazoG37] synthetase (radical SAM superfamily)
VKIVSPISAHPIFGHTLELNILGEQKVCNFDCTYCSLGASHIRISRLKQDAIFTPIDEIISAVGRVLSESAQNGTAIDTILVAGNGEPTLHPMFLHFAKGLVARRAELASSTNSFSARGGGETRIVCVTNGDRLDDRDIVDALGVFDECVVKLDGGTEKAFKKINRPLSRSSLEKVILGARALKNLSIQTTVVGGDFSLVNPTQLEEWIEVLAMLSPKKVYLNRAQPPCADPSVKFVTDDDMHRISHWLERRLKIKAQVELGSAA